MKKTFLNSTLLCETCCKNTTARINHDVVFLQHGFCEALFAQIVYYKGMPLLNGRLCSRVFAALELTKKSSLVQEQVC